MTKNVESKPDNSQLNDLIVETNLSNISGLDRDRIHDVKGLIGSELWATFDNGIRRQIGGVVYKLVEHSLLPLTYAGKTSSNKHTYWIAKLV